MVKWEYKYFNWQGGERQDEMQSLVEYCNLQGQLGWELISGDFRGVRGPYYHSLWFKRQATDPRKE